VLEVKNFFVDLVVPTLCVRIDVASFFKSKVGGEDRIDMKRVRYTPEQREWAVGQMKAPHNRSVVALAKETGITEVTLRTWRDAARGKGELVPAGDAIEDWSGSVKFRVVLETAPLSEGELAEYCRAKAILPEQVQQWREACEQANAPESKLSGLAVVVHPEAKQKIRQLERELRRKNEALAEAAALFVLRKKADAIWGKEEDE
jgi:transposase-like protein